MSPPSRSFLQPVTCAVLVKPSSSSSSNGLPPCALTRCAHPCCRYLLTPELPVIVSTISSPVPLLLCLWCMLSPSDRNRLRNNVSGKQHSTGISHRISGGRSITLFSSRFHVILLDVLPVSDDGIERGAALHLPALCFCNTLARCRPRPLPHAYRPAHHQPALRRQLTRTL